MTDKLRKLTGRQERFVAEYMHDLNATQAAKRAGYSPATVHVQGPRLLGNVSVAAAIEAGKATIRESQAITAGEVLNGLRSEAQGKKDSTSGSRVQAWAHLGKHLQLFEDRSTFDGKLTIEIVRFGEQAIECEDVESIEVAD